jgi:ubiquinone/menaquinone biosynthesis C-methylase UbiE
MERDIKNLEIPTIERLVDVRGKKVLEIGCGDGRITAHIAGKAKEYTAIDPDSHGIATAKANIKGVDFRVGSGENLELTNSSFDVVLYSLSLHHQDSRLALREAHRVLRRQGQLVVLEPAADGELQQFFNIFHDESEALEDSLKVINTGDFTINRQETFYTDWVFDNKEDVYNYDFGGQEYGIDIDDRIIEKMNKQLGEKLDDRPIYLRDKLNIFSLTKKD